MLSQATLKAQLVASMGAASSEAQGVANFATAYGTYAADAAVVPTGTPITLSPVGVAAGKAAMRAAMVGISAPGAGPALLVAGLVAFWGAVAAGITASFAGCTLITPPPLAGLAAALAPVLAANVADGASLDTAMDRLSAVIHAQTVVGGTATYPGPVASPIL